MAASPRMLACAALPALVTLALATRSTALPVWPHDTFASVRIAPAAYNQQFPKIAADGAGGWFYTWQQQSASTGWDVYAQHVVRDGSVAPGWPAGGISLYAGGNDQTNPTVMSDGAGGAYFAWEDARATPTSRDIYVERLAADGSIPSGWIAGGNVAQFDSHDEYAPVLASDGAGGVFVIWTYFFATNDTDIYGARFNPNGTKGWANVLVGPALYQYAPALCSDGGNGLFVSYTDSTATTGHDVRVMHVQNNGLVGFNVGVDVTVNYQDNSAITSDGEGGSIVAFLDDTFGLENVYAIRLTSTGAVATGWPSSGAPVCLAMYGQREPSIVSDGNHGCIIGWLDFRSLYLDLYAQHLDPYGAVMPGWVTDGNTVANNPCLRTSPAMAPDGSGGAFFAWADNRGGVYGVYGLRLMSGGSIAPGGAFNGVQIRSGPNTALKPSIAFDGASAAGLAWRDDRSGTQQIYSQRFDRFGVLGYPEPQITKVKDVAKDQGGHVAVVWNASWLDSDPIYSVTSYWMWRQVPLSLAQAAVARGAAWADVGDVATTELPRRGLYMRSPESAAGYAWEFLTSLAASGFPTYSYVASTTSDSMGSGNPRTAFLVQARGQYPGTYWSSQPDSGYSVDNLPPTVPAPFVGVYASLATALHWNPNLEPDLANYRLYRGSSAGFVPSALNRIASPPDTGYSDPTTGKYFYKLSAVDIHGNESGFALVSPGTTTDAPGPNAPAMLALAPIAPNPARGPLSVNYSLPEAANVTLAIYDASGRRVCTLARGEHAPGAYAIPWDGRDDGGRTAPDGLYFVRLEVAGRALNQRFVRMR